ncbi:MAG: 4Fe-4S binding protein [Methanomassiliicoccus sp.]|nr:4Fe-4S binding protein [Methanomassiliicoccus sp.]
MFKFLKLGVLKNGVQTRNYPQERNPPFDAFLGLPAVDAEACDRCSDCVHTCPTQAITVLPTGIEISAERCIFCAACAEACEAITMSKRFELASRSREGLKVVYRHG